MTDDAFMELLVRHIAWQTKAITDMARMISELARAQLMAAQLDAEIVKMLRGRHDDGEDWKR